MDRDRERLRGQGRVDTPNHSFITIYQFLTWDATCEGNLRVTPSERPWVRSISDLVRQNDDSRDLNITIPNLSDFILITICRLIHFQQATADRLKMIRLWKWLIETGRFLTRISI